MEPFGQRTPLGHCRRCASRLIYTVSAVGLDDEVIVARRCPECELLETVVVSGLQAAGLYRRDTQALLGMLWLVESLGVAAGPRASGTTGWLPL